VPALKAVAAGARAAGFVVESSILVAAALAAEAAVALLLGADEEVVLRASAALPDLAAKVAAGAAETTTPRDGERTAARNVGLHWRPGVGAPALKEALRAPKRTQRAGRRGRGQRAGDSMGNREQPGGEPGEAGKPDDASRTESGSDLASAGDTVPDSIGECVEAAGANRAECFDISSDAEVVDDSLQSQQEEKAKKKFEVDFLQLDGKEEYQEEELGSSGEGKAPTEVTFEEVSETNASLTTSPNEAAACSRIELEAGGAGPKGGAQSAQEALQGSSRQHGKEEGEQEVMAADAAAKAEVVPFKDKHSNCKKELFGLLTEDTKEMWNMAGGVEDRYVDMAMALERKEDRITFVRAVLKAQVMVP